MAINFKKRFWKTGRWFGLLFVLLFLFRLIYGYVAVDITSASRDYTGNFFSSVDNLRKNYASEKILTQGTQSHIGASSNQKFEKTAIIKTRTDEFDKDEAKIKSTAKSYNGIIQYEQNLGQKGKRQIHLVIGINPEQFDVFYTDIQKIGKILNSEITKVDKTNEYRQLNAKKISVEKTLISLKELQSRGGKISDFIALNEKILEIEERLQGLGVELGNFDSINEFCTVKLSLYEGKELKPVGLFHRIKVAFEWSIKCFLAIVFSLLLVSCVVLVLLLIIDRLQVIKILIDKFKE